MKAAEVYEQVTAALVAQLERGDLGEWSAPWHGRQGLPVNAQTGVTYRGGDVLALWAAQLHCGYSSSHWATYRQWGSLGRQVHRGQRATHGVKWVPKRGAEGGADVGDPTLWRLERRMFPVGFAVFNVDQTEPAEAFDGVPWEPEPVGDSPDPIPACAEFFDRIGARIVDGPPAYLPTLDGISMPPLAAFDTAEAYYATTAHEHAHWTGHATRLARDLSGRFGCDAYAAEELVAELAAAYLAATLGIETQPRVDHAQYLASWIRVLRADSKALYRAATLAQAAADYLSAAAWPVRADLGSAVRDPLMVEMAA